MSEAAVHWCSVKQLLQKLSLNSQRNNGDVDLFDNTTLTNTDFNSEATAGGVL